MSATLTWYNSGLGTKTGTAVGNLFADLETLIDSKVADANFSWQKASANVGSSPYQITLKPKSGAAGRILLVLWSSSPAGNNAAILDSAPTNNALYITYFPAGNVDTPSNLSASSGTIMGNDTNVLKCTGSMPVVTVYAASYQPFYFDSAEALVFGFQHAGTQTGYMTGSGLLMVDAADNAYAANLRNLVVATNGFGSSPIPYPWLSTAPTPSSTGSHVLVNYGSNNSAFYCAYSPTGLWANQAVGSADILTDTSNSRAYFAPIPMLGTTKGQGPVLKLRQIALGPGTVGAFSVYNTTGPVVVARQFNASSSGGTGFPWLVNFKL